MTGEQSEKEPGRKHEYAVDMAWTGDLGRGTADYRAYSRDHEIRGTGKATAIMGSSEALFRGDPSRYTPEELLVGSLSSCHMLWVLHLCADAGIVVTSYTDRATGSMMEEPDGAGRFIEVTLHPRMVITEPSRIADAEALHHRAHRLCFIANSVNFPVGHKPLVTSEPARPL